MKPTLKLTSNKVKGALSGVMLACALSVAPTFAESISMSVADQRNQSIVTPKYGIKKDKVMSQYGEPIQRVAAVGEPPISKWVYQDFTVYFENDTVLHSVRHRS